MANALRPGDILKNKRNVNPSLDPYTEARAEDFEEVSTILEDHADKLDAMVQPEKFYGFHTSLENLIAAHPTAVENGWATIIPTNGNPPYTATYTSGVWTASVSKAPIQYYTTQTALLSTTGQEGIIYVVKDQKLLYLWYDNKFNAFGKDGANGKDAYEVAVAFGFPGSETEWLASLQGLDNYQLWLQNGNTGTYEDFFEASRGPRGYDGDPGAGFENIPATPDQIPVTDGVGGIAWQPKPTGGGGSNINRYLTIAAMLAAQGSQTDKSVQFVADASADPTVDSGYAYYEYLGTTAGTLADYRKLSEEESMDVDPGGLDVRMVNLVADLSTAEKDAIKAKLGIASGLTQDDIDEPIVVNTSRNLAATDIGKVLFVTAGVTLTYPAGGIPKFKCNIMCSETGWGTLAGQTAELDFPDGQIIEARKAVTLFLRPDDSRLTGYGEFTE